MYIINKLPTSILENKTPLEKLYGQLQSLDHLKVFGCLCFASTLAHTRNKFEPRSIPCVFLRYPFGVKGYKLLNLLIKKFFLSRDVIFHETMFPFESTTYSPHSSLSLPHIFPLVATRPDFTSPLVPESFPSTHIDISVDSSTSEPALPDVSVPSVSTDFNPFPANFADSSSSPLPPNPPLRKSARVSKPPAYVEDYKCNNVTCDDHALSTFSNMFGSAPITSGTKYPLSQYLDSSKLSSSYSLYCSLIAAIPEPKFYHEAVKDPKWQDAMTAEINALESNHTWTLTPLPPHKRAIGCKWVYKGKYKADGFVERYKAQLVTKGFTQQEGLDFTKTFSPVAKMTTIKTLLAIPSW